MRIYTLRHTHTHYSKLKLWETLSWGERRKFPNQEENQKIHKIKILKRNEIKREKTHLQLKEMNQQKKAATVEQ